MPELPEVETMRRGILGIVGARIAGVERPACRRRPILIAPRIDHFSRRLRGQRIAAVDRLGKRVVLRIEDGQTVAIEPRMTGLVLVADPPTPDHLRLRFRLVGSEPRELLFWDRRGLGTVRLYAAGELERALGAGRLGPDALATTADGLRERLAASRRAIKVALLDQKAVAGVGNLYAAEILHVAGVDPRTPCTALARVQWQRITAAMQAVLREAIAHEGSTLADGTYRNALNVEGGYQNHHRVYDRAGRTCTRCGEAAIRRIVQAQRSTFFCPRCQRRRGVHATVATGTFP